MASASVAWPAYARTNGAGQSVSFEEARYARTSLIAWPSLPSRRWSRKSSSRAIGSRCLRRSARQLAAVADALRGVLGERAQDDAFQRRRGPERERLRLGRERGVAGLDQRRSGERAPARKHLVDDRAR